MIRIRAPGRICLFGEHQDYLNYPTISMAISKYIFLRAEKIVQNTFLIDLPDINKELEIPLKNKELEYKFDRDYLRSGYNQLIRKGMKFNIGYKIKINGNIPINAGSASSSALVVAWLYFLNLISNKRLNQYQLALECFNTEVKEFGEAGGKMDFFSSIYGNLLYLKFKKNKQEINNYRMKLEGFILGDSLQKKETVEDLKKVKEISIKAFKILDEIMPNFNKYKTDISEIQEYLPSIDKVYRRKIIGNILNRDITVKAKNLLDQHYKKIKKLNKSEINQFYKKLGLLINEHQTQLRKNIGITTVKIDKMIANCLDFGGLGAKINGSGFGGTIFTFGIDRDEELITAIRKSGGVPYEIKTSSGVELY